MELDDKALLAKYPDPEWQRRFLEVTALVNFLHGSIISDAYKPSDDLNAAIPLSPVGDKVMLHLQRRESVPIKEARLLCLLVTAHTEPLVDFMRVDLDKLSAAISAEVLDRSLLYPFIYGRRLYDRFADLHEDERTSLNLDETLALLDEEPVGVYQERHWVLGPYGVMRSRAARRVPVLRRIPLRHCSDPTCDAVHGVRLETSDEAAVNKHRTRMHKHLEKGAPRGWHWGSFTRAVEQSDVAAYDDLNTGTLPLLLGDCLALEELRVLATALLNSGSGFREVVATVGLKGRADSIVAGLDQPKLLQLLLLLPDQSLLTALDECVYEQAIHVPRTEVRRPVVNGSKTTGAWGAQVELGARGVRISTLPGDVPTLRLQRLISELYGVEVASAADDLEWLLREVDGPNLEARLAEFLRTTTPGDVVLRLIAMRKDKVLGTAKHLRFNLPESTSDGEVVEHVLWRLALTADEPSDPHADYWRQHEALEQRLTTAAISPLLDEEAIRSLAANYFVALEGLLDDSLHFATWVLTHDHFSSPRPFTFRPTDSRRHSTERLNELAKRVPEQPPDYSEDRATLYSLCLGFRLLGEHLSSLSVEADSHLRAKAEQPERFEHTTLQAFPFNHVVPYLDLQPEARERMLTALKSVGKVLLDSRVSEIRNQQLHFRRSRADSDRFVECLRAAREAVHVLETSGLARFEFGFERREVDQFGRASVRLRDARGKEVTFARPSRFNWCGLPELSERQYLVTGATFAEPNEMFRFVLQEDSLFAASYDGFPRRPKPRERAVADVSDAPY